MPRPKGIVEKSPRAKGAGRPQSLTYEERYKQEPDGTSVIRLPNRVLTYLEKRAAEEGVSIPQYLARLEINLRIL